MHWFFFGRTRSVHIQFLRYLFVGGSSAVVDLLSFAVFIEYFHIHYLIAALFSYILGLSWNYLFCLFWVFESRHSRWKEVVMILGIASGGLAWTELLLYLAVDWGGFAPLISKIVVLWIVLAWNFSMRKLYVFH